MQQLLSKEWTLLEFLTRSSVADVNNQPRNSCWVKYFHPVGQARSDVTDWHLSSKQQEDNLLLKQRIRLTKEQLLNATDQHAHHQPSNSRQVKYFQSAGSRKIKRDKLAHLHEVAFTWSITTYPDLIVCLESIQLMDKLSEKPVFHMTPLKTHHLLYAMVSLGRLLSLFFTWQF